MTVDYRTGEILDPLTAMERSALTHAEAKIERGLSSFIEVGEALAEVRDSRLYREIFGTFEAYCRDRWGITDRRARQMIDATTIVTSMPTGTVVPVTESQARELSGLAPEDAAEVMEVAEDISGGKITAAKIAEAREIVFPTGPTFISATDALAELVADDAEVIDENETVAVESGEIIPIRPASSNVVGIDGKTYKRPTPKPAPLKPVANEDEWTQQDRAEELAADLAAHLSLLFALTVPERRAEFIANWHLGVDHRPVLGQKYVKPSVMREIADALHTFATEWENANV